MSSWIFYSHGSLLSTGQTYIFSFIEHLWSRYPNSQTVSIFGDDLTTELLWVSFFWFLIIFRFLIYLPICNDRENVSSKSFELLRFNSSLHQTLPRTHPKMAPIRVGIIGLSPNAVTSWASAAHLPYLVASKGKYEIKALCNSSVESAQAAIKTYKLPSTTKAYGTPQDLANDPDVSIAS